MEILTATIHEPWLHDGQHSNIPNTAKQHFRNVKKETNIPLIIIFSGEYLEHQKTPILAVNVSVIVLSLAIYFSLGSSSVSSSSP
jgi:hypothetical protein